MVRLEHLILKTTTAGWEREGIEAEQLGPIVGAVDKTFLEQMLLMFIALVNGYMWHEVVADNRSYETWYEWVKSRLEPMQTRVLYLISDQAKALIKLAEMGLE